MTRRLRSRVALVGALSAMLGGLVLFSASPTQAVVNNPGAVTFTVKGGTFIMNKADPDGDPPLSFKFPNLLGPWACNDGLDNDGDGFTDGADAECDPIAGTNYPVGAFVENPTNQADTNEAMDGYQGVWECNDGVDQDLDGLYDHSSLNPTTPDTGTGQGCSYANDNDEDASGNQFYITPKFNGSVAGDGSVSVTTATFQNQTVSFDASAILGPGTVIKAVVSIIPEGFPWTGSVNPDFGSGEVTMDSAKVTIKIVVQGIGQCRIGAPDGSNPIVIDNLTTGTSGSLTGSPAAPGGNLATIVRGDFGMNVVPVDEPGFDCALMEASMIDFLNLPNTSGNDASFTLQSSFTPLGNGAIGGTVVEDGTGDPLAGVWARVRDKNTNTFVTKVLTDSNGEFEATGLPPGDYVVWYQDPDGSHNDEYNGGGSTFGGAPAVTVAASQKTTANASLAPGGGLTVNTTDATTTNPLGGVTVRVRNSATNTFVTAFKTQAGGSYTKSMVPGDYKLLFEAPGYVSEWATNQPGWAKANPVTVPNGGSVVVDADLSMAS